MPRRIKYHILSKEMLLGVKLTSHPEESKKAHENMALNNGGLEMFSRETDMAYTILTSKLPLDVG